MNSYLTTVRESYSITTKNPCVVTAYKNGKEYKLLSLAGGEQGEFKAISGKVYYTDPEAVILPFSDAPIALVGGRGLRMTEKEALAVGSHANATAKTATSVGTRTAASGTNAVAIGADTTASAVDSVVVGANSNGVGGATVCIGAQTSASIYAGSSVAVGYKATASTKGDVMVGYVRNEKKWSQPNTYMGYGVKTAANATKGGGNVIIGTTTEDVDTENSISVGVDNNAGQSTSHNIVIGSETSSIGNNSTLIGSHLINEDDNVIVLGTTVGDSTSAKQTLLYIVGANSPLATKYENGNAFMGFVVRDGNGDVIKCGTKALHEIFTNNTNTSVVSFMPTGLPGKPIFEEDDDEAGGLVGRG